jgi:hypothetical protein
MLHKGHKMYEVGKQCVEGIHELTTPEAEPVPAPKLTEEELRTFLAQACTEANKTLPQDLAGYLLIEEMSVLDRSLGVTVTLLKLDRDVDPGQRELAHQVLRETNIYKTRKDLLGAVCRTYNIPLVFTYKDKYGRHVGTNTIPTTANSKQG